MCCASVDMVRHLNAYCEREHSTIGLREVRVVKRLDALSAVLTEDMVYREAAVAECCAKIGRYGPAK